MELYRVSHLTFGYYPYDEKTGERAKKSVEILHDISFTVSQGSFVLLCGATGCGKSTLLLLLKKELQPSGELSGDILFEGKPFCEWPDRETAGGIGFVMQNPSDQCVTDKVWHEMAFGLENLGAPPSEIRRRVAEISAYFGIDEWYEKKVEELSGGQKQLLNLASVMVMNPRVLILDEPTAQLDPIAARNFLNVLHKLNRELGITVILAEHRLEETMCMADRVMVMENGNVIANETANVAAGQIPKCLPVYRALPESVRLFRQFESTSRKAACPLTVSEGRQYLLEHFETEPFETGPLKTGRLGEEPFETGHSEKADQITGIRVFRKEPEAALELRDVWFRYERQGADILRGTSVKIRAGELVCLLGSNGSGKTTVLKMLAGILKPQEGKLLIHGKRMNAENAARIGYLPQDIETLFVADTVSKELSLVGALNGQQEEFKKLEHCHPYDLSGGEKQLLGLTKVLAGDKEILLLDEPTKGLDVSAKERIRQRLLEEKKKGTTILLVTHDPEFASSCADRCGLFFRGSLISLEETKRFFQGNRFYTTAAARIAKGFYEDVVTSEELYEACAAHRKTEHKEEKQA